MKVKTAPDHGVGDLTVVRRAFPDTPGMADGRHALAGGACPILSSSQG